MLLESIIREVVNRFAQMDTLSFRPIRAILFVNYAHLTASNVCLILITALLAVPSHILKIIHVYHNADRIITCNKQCFNVLPAFNHAPTAQMSQHALHAKTVHLSSTMDNV